MDISRYERLTASTSPARTSPLLTLIGTGLIIGGLYFLFMLGSIIYQIFYDPEQSRALHFVQQALVSQDQLISGKIDGKEFSFHVNEATRNFFFILMAILGLGIVFGIINSTILTGATLVRLGNSRPCPTAAQHTDEADKAGTSAVIR